MADKPTITNKPKITKGAPTAALTPTECNAGTEAMAYVLVNAILAGEQPRFYNEGAKPLFNCYMKLTAINDTRPDPIIIQAAFLTWGAYE